MNLENLYVEKRLAVNQTKSAKTQHPEESKTTMGFLLQYTNKSRKAKFPPPLTSLTHCIYLLELALAIHNNPGGMAISPILATICSFPDIA